MTCRVSISIWNWTTANQKPTMEMIKLNVLFGDNRNDIKYKKDENLCHQRRSSIIFWSQFFTPFNSFIIKKRSAIIAVFSPSFFRGLYDVIGYDVIMTYDVTCIFFNFEKCLQFTQKIKIRDFSRNFEIL